MNKTVNINLANTFFHIDEEAYTKLRRYLDAIKHSFAGTSGSDEILADIETRVAELFLEKVENERQVITQLEVDQVITIMGQPEDYMVDEDIFEDAPKAKQSSKSVKKLYRDVDQKYIGGVCAGLEHYLGLDMLWIRIIFGILAVFGSGFGLIVYLILWVLVPEAATTSQKLDMSGKAINISNIERKVKEGFDDVADKVKNVDYEKVGDKVKSGSKTLFDTLGDIFLFLFKVFGKFIGILLIIIGAAGLIALFVGLFSVSIIDAIHFPGFEFVVQNADAPIWLVSLLAVLGAGIPLFFILYLGLKILVNNLKSIGAIAKYALLGLWLLSIGGLIAYGVKEATDHAYTSSSTLNENFATASPLDTVRIRMRASENLDYENSVQFNGMRLIQDDNGASLLYSADVRFDIRMAEDGQTKLKIRKDADGSSFDEARERATQIDYHYTLGNQEIVLNDYLTTDPENKVRDQEVRITLYFPEDALLVFDKNATYHMNRHIKNNQDYNRDQLVDHSWRMGKDGELKCADCTSVLGTDESDSRENRIILDENGVDINLQDDGESFKVKIDENGVRITTDEKN